MKYKNPNKHLHFSSTLKITMMGKEKSTVENLKGLRKFLTFLASQVSKKQPMDTQISYMDNEKRCVKIQVQRNLLILLLTYIIVT